MFQPGSSRVRCCPAHIPVSTGGTVSTAGRVSRQLKLLSEQLPATRRLALNLQEAGQLQEDRQVLFQYKLP
jgi:hypothetical protein